MANLINVERATVSYGTRTLLNGVSLGVEEGDAVGVVGRNGDGKSTLLQILTRTREPDSGRVTHTSGLSVGYLHQSDDFAADATVREVIVGGRADHVWAAEPETRDVVSHLLGGVDLDRTVGALSGGERRRVALAAQLIAGHDVLVLDEPTNHLDVEVIAWLAEHLNRRRAKALVVVSHDRWFLDAVCTRTWEVHDGTVDAYDGGYAAYVLARAERMRLAAGAEARRQNLMRKELAWLRRGPPARTSKPKFRIQAANELIANEPPPRDSLVLQRFATTRLGKDVFDLHRVRLEAGDNVVLDKLDWSIGPGARIGLVGVNGTGKTTVLRLLAGELAPTSGTIKRGATLRIGYLSQALAELDGNDRVLDAVENRRRVTELAGGREITADTLLRDFGFTGDKLTTKIADLSGGERRRLQFLRMLLDEPNVLLLDEPTNDLDIDTLTVIEDYLDGWPGTLIVVSHDRYFLERVSDVTYALTGGGRCDLLPGGVEQYLADRAARASAASAAPQQKSAQPKGESAAARERRASKEMARIEGQLSKLEDRITALHETMAEAANDHVRLAELNTELQELLSRKDELEESWLALAEE
ncbi:ABC transporter ATPase [Mycolicibacterium phlei]|jgi:ATP-binding cassette subfamily F protein uup|uniref:Glycerophosphoryl diester phosphodiesterase n=1 Tax=Mycolicibacterium phlei DSM 43239 = CCUG 21000 TaxID=1226750 RepID=A0A5N5UZC1_MYCPH|nr:ABC-F family ATP-binding cassette domain-containing protein [Mycolicibacterium phlei]VEG09183.1 ABC transporter ATPase [Mycobacteroides chelonae]AMO61067.1 putative ABC transporter ATP-binding protein YjjK [Mycolicibacterium phlei]EID08966.1 ABC transporter ATPase [Mycolicibacterium phlei RIVM601174]KAB7754985.1 glycerophosphoryl diester phosphodiesterase [Mycolicibacterium phlei DSM 43239 = CCUG 21000]KXW64041.1 glycerophosphoryl diester phosphodiesterase [Mycolicibacterium phlei DSM 43239